MTVAHENLVLFCFVLAWKYGLGNTRDNDVSEMKIPFCAALHQKTEIVTVEMAQFRYMTVVQRLSASPALRHPTELVRFHSIHCYSRFNCSSLLDNEAFDK